MNFPISTDVLTLFKGISQNTIKELRNTTNDLKLPLLKTSNGEKNASLQKKHDSGTS